MHANASIRTYDNECAALSGSHFPKSCLRYGELYMQREYVDIIKSPDMRRILTKFRIHMNCAVDSCYRSFRRKNVDSGACPCGCEKQMWSMFYLSK